MDELEKRFRENRDDFVPRMPQGHRDRFEKSLPKSTSNINHRWIMGIAASVTSM